LFSFQDQTLRDTIYIERVLEILVKLPRPKNVLERPQDVARGGGVRKILELQEKISRDQKYG
jgi:hypothetical protein